MKWSVETARRFAAQGRLDDWIQSYLSAGCWANVGLLEGLKKEQRWWTGPILIPIAGIIRTCGPEPEMPYKVTSEHWEKKTQEITLRLDDPIKLPPVIIENVKGYFYLRDGNHRLEAARKKGWQSIWALIWFNSERDWKENKFQKTF